MEIRSRDNQGPCRRRFGRAVPRRRRWWRASALAGVALTLLARAAWAAEGDPAVPECTGLIDVHVVDGITHEPMAGATVTVDGAAVGRTDARGQLSVAGLCPRTVVVAASRAEYEGAPAEITPGAAAAVELELFSMEIETTHIIEKAVQPEDMRSTAALSGEALERKRGQPLSDILTQVPGVTELRSGSGMAKPIVRGQFGRRLLVMVDGVRHRAQEWGLDHAPEVDPSMADRITVVRGTSGVRFGPDAIGGVVLVDPPDMPRRPGTQGETHIVGFSNGLGGSLMSRARGSPAAAPGLGWQLDGSFKRLQAASTPDYPLDNTGEREWSLGGGAGYRAGGGTYKVSYRRYEATLGVCSCYHFESAADFNAALARGRPLGSNLYTADFQIERPYQAVEHDLALARGSWRLASGTLTATYALQHDHRREYEIVRQAVAGPQFNFRLWTHDADAVFEHNPIHVSEHLHLQGSFGLVGMAQVNGYHGLPLIPDHRAASGGVYAIERLWGHELEVEAGVRYDVLARRASFGRSDFLRLARSGQVAQDACGQLDDTTESVECGSLYHTVAASLGALRRLSPRWTAKLDLSVASRPPNPDEQYLNGTSPTYPVYGLGRPDLGAETSTSISLTTSFAGTYVSGEVSGFANPISDYIYFAPAIGEDGKPILDVLIRGTFPRFVTRPVDALFWGADGGLTVTPLPWLQLTGQAALVRARNLSDDSYLLFVPPDRYRGSVALTRKGLLGAGRAFATFGGTWVARQSRFDPLADLAPPPDGYFLADGELGAEALLGGETLRVTLQGSNVLGARYREYTSLLRYFADQPGRQLMLRITVTYGSRTN